MLTRSKLYDKIETDKETVISNKSLGESKMKRITTIKRNLVNVELDLLENKGYELYNLDDREIEHIEYRLSTYLDDMNCDNRMALEQMVKDEISKRVS